MNKYVKERIILSLKCQINDLQLHELSVGLLSRSKISEAIKSLASCVEELKLLPETEEKEDVQIIIRKHLKGEYIKNEADYY